MLIVPGATGAWGTGVGMGVVFETGGVTATSRGMSSEKGVDVGAGEGVAVGSCVAVGEGGDGGDGSGVAGGWTSEIRVGRRPAASSWMDSAESWAAGIGVAEAIVGPAAALDGAVGVGDAAGDGSLVSEPRARLMAKDNSTNRGQAS